MLRLEPIRSHGEQELATVGDVLVDPALAVHANADASIGGLAALYVPAINSEGVVVLVRQ